MASTVANNISSLAKQLKPYWQGDIDITLQRRGVSGNGAGGGAGAGGALTAHDISGPFHTGTLANSQAPQFLLTDGSRTLTGDWEVADGVTIDTMNPSQHMADVNAHHFRATAGDGISMSAEQEFSVDEAFAFQWTGIHTFHEDVQVHANLDFVGGDRTITATSDLFIDLGGDLILPPAQTFRSDDYEDGIPITGFSLFQPGGLGHINRQLTINSIKTDEFHTRLFVADTVRIDIGEEYWGKSMGIVHSDFTTPASIGGTVTAIFEDSPLMPAEIFTSGDWILIRFLDDAVGFEFGSIWGQVSGYTDLGLDENERGHQSWTFTLRSGATEQLVKAGNIAVDFGVSGQGFVHLSTLQSADGPWIRIGDWTLTTPYESGSMQPRTQIGLLDGIGDAEVNPEGWGLYSDNAFLKGILRTPDTLINETGIWIQQYDYAFPESPGGSVIAWVDDVAAVGTGSPPTTVFSINSQTSSDIAQDIANIELYQQATSSTAQLSVRAVGESSQATLALGASGEILLYSSSNDVQVRGHLKPQNDLTYDLGTASERWRQLHVDQLFVTGSISGDTLSGAEWEFAGSMIIDAHSAASTLVQIVNQGAGTASLSVEGNITLGGTVDGVDIAAHNASPSAHHALATGGDGVTVSGAQVVAVNSTVVRTTRQILTPTNQGITGGGDLETDLSLTVDGTVVRTTRTITSGLGLTGGGPLSGNLTLRVGEGDGITVTEDAVAVDSTVVRITRNLTAGAGLTGGGTLAADRTFTVGAGDGITVNADDIAIDLVTNSGLVVDVSGLRLGTPTTLTVSTLDSVTTSTHAHNIDSTSDGKTNPNKILHASAAGQLLLNSLGVNVPSMTGADFMVGNEVIYANVNGNSVGFGRVPDTQFMVDVNGPLRADYLIGKHAIQLKDAVLIAHYDGSELSDAGELNGHMGQVGTVNPSNGRVVFVRGKYGKALSIGPVSTGIVLNPSFETDLSSWTAETGTLARLAPEEAAHGQYVGHYTSPSAATGVVYAAASATTAGTDLGFNVWLRGEASTTACRIVLQNSGRSVTYATSSITVTPEWKMYSVFGTVPVGHTSVIGVVVVDTVSSVVLIDAAQIVSGYGYAIPFVPGNRSAMTYVDYTISGIRNDRGTVMVWVRPWSIGGGGGYVLRLGTTTATRHELYFNASGTVQGIVGTAARISTTVPTLGEWTHLALTWERGTAQLYVNGVAEGASFSYVTTATPTVLRIGNNTGTLHGEVEDVVILARASPASEVRAVYESDAPVFAESSVFTFRATPKGLVWADEEGLWIKDSDGEAVAGFYGGEAASKSWGGVSLAQGDILFGRYGVSEGGWLEFDRDGYVSQPLLSMGYGETTVLEINNDHARLAGTNLEILTAGGGTVLGVFAAEEPPASTWGGVTVAINDVVIGDRDRPSAGNGNVILWRDATREIFIGNTLAGKSNVHINASRLAMREGTTDRVSVSNAGILTINDSLGNAVFTFDASLGAEFTKPLTLGTAGGIYQGTASFSSPTTGIGLKIFNESGIGKLATYNNTLGGEQIVIDTDGKLKAGAGAVYMDSTGITITRAAGSSPNAINAYAFAASGSTIGGLYAYTPASSSEMLLQHVATGVHSALNITNTTSSNLYSSGIQITATRTGGGDSARITLSNYVAGLGAEIAVSGDYIGLDGTNDVEISTTDFLVTATTSQLGSLTAKATTVGINTATPTANEASSRLTVQANDSSAHYASVINEGNGNTGLIVRRLGTAASRWLMYAPAGTTEFRITGGADELKLTAAGVLTPSGGISFGNEALNTYDEGSWTPAITAASGTPTTLTYTAQTGKYTRIGNVLFYTIRIQINAFTVGAATGDMRISLPTTLPAAAENNTRGVAGLSGFDLTVVATDVAFAPNPGQAYGTIIATSDNAAQTVQPITGLAAGDLIVISGLYFTS